MNGSPDTLVVSEDPRGIIDVVGCPPGRDIEVRAAEPLVQDLEVLSASGKVTIKPGKSKIFFTRKDGRLHLLDCTCPLCEDLRKDASP
jgi:hypothetical protein